MKDNEINKYKNHVLRLGTVQAEYDVRDTFICVHMNVVPSHLGFTFFADYQHKEDDSKTIRYYKEYTINEIDIEISKLTIH